MKTYHLELIPILGIDTDETQDVGVKLYFVDRNNQEHQILYSDIDEVTDYLKLIIKSMKGEF